MQAAEKEAAWFDLKVNTSVYVQGLPDDVSEAEMVQARPARGSPRPGSPGRCSGCGSVRTASTAAGAWAAFHKRGCHQGRMVQVGSARKLASS